MFRQVREDGLHRVSNSDKNGEECKLTACSVR